MQGTTTKPRGSPKETPKKVSPRPARQLKLNPVELTSPSSSNHTAPRTPKDKCSKLAERTSPRTPISEKRRPSKLSQLESQITQLQEDLKKVKDRLIVSETSKKEAQEDAEQVRKEFEDVCLKLEESQKKLTELVSSREASLVEIQNVSQEKDGDHFLESDALKSAHDEIQRLKQQLEMVIESRDENDELQSLKTNLEEARSIVENMKTELRNSKESEEQAQKMVRETLHQLEAAKETVNTLRLDAVKSSDAYNSVAYELEKSKTRVNILEGIVSKLNTDLMKTDGQSSGEDVNQLKSDIEQLKTALEEQTHKNELMRNTKELLEEIKAQSKARESELELELMKANASVEELKANLMDKETELQGISEENENLYMRIEKTVSCPTERELEMEMKKLRENVADMKECLMDKETELQNILEENMMLKLELKNREMNKGFEKQQVTAEMEASRAAEQDAMTKLDYMTEEIDNSKRKAARVTEQLEAAQKANTEMEAELRRLKVQSDQWRKAAEAAASMLSPGSNGKYVERTGSMPSYSPIGGKLSSPYLDGDDEDDTFRKKNGNVLKKIGVLWKKPQK